MKPLHIILLAIIAIVGSNSFFIVTETELAILFRLGKVVETDYKPGIHFKLPFFNNVRKFERRIMTVDIKPEHYLTEEKKNVVVNSFIKWRISDVGKYYRSMRGSETKAMDRISKIVKDGLRAEFGKRTIHEVVSGQKHLLRNDNQAQYQSDDDKEKHQKAQQTDVAVAKEMTTTATVAKDVAQIDERTQIMNSITLKANKEVALFGISIVDVRIKRIDLTPKVSESVYMRMEAERKQIAKNLRAQGKKHAEEIEASAERERTVILAKAYRNAEDIRGEGDAKSTEIYAQAYGKDKEFYTFYRSLNAYKNAFTSGSDILVLKPDSEFFKYFSQSK